ncbi:MAG: response regulator transcription factor [Candidatus Latescibacterota bacterium]
MRPVLLVGDQHDCLEQLARDLTAAGYRTASMDGEAFLSSEDDAITAYAILLLQMDTEDLATVRAKLRQAFEGRRKPPLLLVGSEEQMRASDLLVDADDYIVLPTSAIRASLRVKIALDRTMRYDPTDAIKRGNLSIHPHTYEVYILGERVDLTLKEYELLKFLVAHVGRVYTRDVLLEQVWGYDYFGGIRTVDVHIRRIRSKLEREGCTFIETVRGVGYRFVVGE